MRRCGGLGVWMSLRNLFASLLLASCLASMPAAAIEIILSTANGATLGGLTFRDGDLARYNTVTGIATLFFDEDLFSANENVDAFDLMSNGDLILSTTNAATLGGLTFGPGDLARYNPGSNTATLFFSGSLFSAAENIDAVSVLSNGNIVLSTANGATLGGLTFRDGDLARYDPVAGTATLYFNENLFSANENVDGADVLGATSIALSTTNAATLGGLSFRLGRHRPVRLGDRHGVAPLLGEPFQRH